MTVTALLEPTQVVTLTLPIATPPAHLHERADYERADYVRVALERTLTAMGYRGWTLLAWTLTPRRDGWTAALKH